MNTPLTIPSTALFFNPKLLQAPGSLLQHFKGWLIETPTTKLSMKVLLLSWTLE